MNILVSVIIPVYNAEKHIGSCIESIQNQTYKHMEIIIVNDGSTDNSGTICDCIAEKDTRIKVYHTPNSGVAAARNWGIRRAHGEIIAFSDSDDLYETDFLEKSMKLIENAEYFSGAFLTISDCNRVELVDYMKEKNELVSIDTYLRRMLDFQAGAYWGANWGKLYYKNIIDEYNIEFESGVQFAEDFRFNLEYLKYVKQVAISHSPIYKYRVDTVNSLSKKKRNSRIYWQEYYELFKRYIALYSRHNMRQMYNAKIYEFLVRAGQIVLRDGIYSNDLKIRTAIKLSNEIAETSEIQNATKYIFDMGTKEKRVLRLLTNHRKSILIFKLYLKKYVNKLLRLIRRL